MGLLEELRPHMEDIHEDNAVGVIKLFLDVEGYVSLMEVDDVTLQAEIDQMKGNIESAGEKLSELNSFEDDNDWSDVKLGQEDKEAAAAILERRLESRAPAAKA